MKRFIFALLLSLNFIVKSGTLSLCSDGGFFINGEQLKLIITSETHEITKSYEIPPAHYSPYLYVPHNSKFVQLVDEKNKVYSAIFEVDPNSIHSFSYSYKDGSIYFSKHF